jgi:hypothetical protein
MLQAILLIVQLLAVERTTFFLHSDRWCCPLCRAESRDKQYSGLREWWGLLHENKAAEMWNITPLRPLQKWRTHESANLN